MSKFNHKWNSYQEACTLFDGDYQEILKDYKYTDDKHENHRGYFICNSGHEWICLACGQKDKTEMGKKQLEEDKKEDDKKQQDENDYINKEYNAMNENQKYAYNYTIRDHGPNRQNHDYIMTCTFSSIELKLIKEKAGTPNRRVYYISHYRPT